MLLFGVVVCCLWCVVCSGCLSLFLLLSVVVCWLFFVCLFVRVFVCLFVRLFDCLFVVAAAVAVFVGVFCRCVVVSLFNFCSLVVVVAAGVGVVCLFV